MELLYTLAYTAELFMPALFLLLVYLLRPQWDRQLRHITGYVSFCLVFNIIAIIFALSGINNLYLYHLFSLVEFTVLSNYLLGLILKRHFTTLFFAVSAVYLVLWVLNIIFLEPLKAFNGNTAGLSCLLLLLMCMYHLLSLSKGEEILYFQKLPSFWIVSGIMVYSALSLLSYISYAYYIYNNPGNEAIELWGIASVSSIIKFALISVGLLCYKRKQRTSQPFLST